MSYDFTTAVDRSRQSSEKWAIMKDRLPDVKEGVIPFSVADMEVKHPPELIQGLVDYLQSDAVLGYTVPYPAYYEAVTGWMRRRHSWVVDREWISISSGIIPALYDLVKAFAEPGEGVILLTPVYYPFYTAVTKNGRKVVACPLQNDGGAYTIDFDALESCAAGSNNKLLLFCSPHNPVGRVWTREELLRVGEICARHGVTIVSDEIHHDLVMPGFRHTVLASLTQELADITITCTAPSKTFNLAGMQMANIIISNPQLRERFREEQSRSGFDCGNALGFRTCEIAYSRCEPWLEELLVLIHHNYTELKNFMQRELPEVKVYPLEGTYLPWMDFRPLGLNGKELEQIMVERAQVFLDDGFLFGQEGDGFGRMNIACPTKVMLDGLQRMAEALKQ